MFVFRYLLAIFMFMVRDFPVMLIFMVVISEKH